MEGKQLKRYMQAFFFVLSKSYLLKAFYHVRTLRFNRRLQIYTLRCILVSSLGTVVDILDEIIYRQHNDFSKLKVDIFCSGTI